MGRAACWRKVRLDFPPISSHFLPFRVNGVDSRLRGNDGTEAG